MEFNPMSGKSSMKRKQSNSLLQALSKSTGSRTSAIPITPSTAYQTPPSSTSTHFAPSLYDDPYSPDSPHYNDGSSSRATSSTFNMPLHSARSTSASTSIVRGDERDKGKKVDRERDMGIRRPEDVFKVVKERLLSWSYLMLWYQGDVHWFNTVKISRSVVEASLGNKIDSRARHCFLLGASLSALFDIQSASEYLKALLKLLEEWESLPEGGIGKGVKSLFRNPRSSKKPNSGVSETTSALSDSESYLLNINLPFQPDFFQVHSSTCSIIRDIYKKFLNMVLPPSRIPPIQPLQSLFHPSTHIHSAPLDNPFPSTATGLFPARSASSSGKGFQNLSTGPATPSGLGVGSVQQDAFQAFVAGDLPPDRTLVGDGQKLTVGVVELFAKVDMKLRKHFSTLLREIDTLARKVLDDELAQLTSSLSTGPPLRFDYGAALSGGGVGWSSDAGNGIGTGTGIWRGIEEDENEVEREREFGTV